MTPFLYAPENVTLDDDDSRIVVAVGSDLLVQVETDGPGRWVYRAYDSSGNHLADLARARESHPALLGLAVDAAVRLFPNHLLLPLEGQR